MSISAVTPGPLARGFLRLSDRRLLLLGLALCLFAGALLAPQRLVVVGLGSAAATLLSLVVLASGVARVHRRRAQRARLDAGAVLERDTAPSFVTDDKGAISYANAAARARFHLAPGALLSEALASTFANPGAILFRMQAKLAAGDASREDIVTRRGQMRLSVHRVWDDAMLWRLDDLPDRAAPNRSDSIALPMLTVGRGDAILFMNDAARRFIGQREKTLEGIFPDLPLRPGGLNRVKAAQGMTDCVIAEVEGQTGRREVYLLPGQGPAGADDLRWDFFDELPVALLKLAPDGTLRQSNRLARRLLGDDAVEGAPLADLMEGLGRSIRDWLEDAIAGRGMSHSEVLRLSRKDRETYVQVTLRRVLNQDEPAIVAVLNDATELKTLEAQFVQSQKMQAIGQLAGGIAHDFNNLLTAISGHCDLLLLRHDEGDPDFADLNQIAQNANRAAALVNQLLAFSRKQTLRPEIVDVRDALSDLAHLLNRLVGETITMTLSHDPSLPSIRADKRQLEQVLMNLVVNARDAMPGGGEIRVETETVTLVEPMTRERAVVAPGRYVSIRVSDDGQGISEDHLKRVFEPFFTTKAVGEGTGLGLSTAYGIVKQSGGFIFVDSVPHQGTVFTLLFPLHETRAEAAPLPVSPMRNAETRAEGVVLLVEDEAPVRAFASRALRMRGHTVIDVDSAEEALKTLEDTSLEVDVFVTDVVMPGMDGPAWVKQALQSRPDTRVVFVSGYAEEAFGDTQAGIPNSVFLPKPFSLTELTEVVQRQLA